MTESQTSITIRLPMDKRQALNKLASDSGIPVAGIIRHLIYNKLAEKTTKIIGVEGEE